MSDYHEKAGCAVNFSFWEKFAYLDHKKERTPQEIDEIMDAVMADLHGPMEEGASEFDKALFCWCFAPYSQEIRDLLNTLLKDGIKKELRKRWELEYA
jgi:hypothetical protein